MNYEELTEEQAQLKARLLRVISKAEDESRDLFPDEAAKFDRLEQRLGETEKQLDAVAPRLPDPSRRLIAPPAAGERRAETGLAAPGGWLGHELRTLSGASGLGQAITPVESASYALDHLAAESVGLQSGFSTLRTEADTLSIPHSTGDGVASWTSENAAITAGDVTGESITAVPRKLAALQISSNEVLADASPDVLQVIQSRLMRAMALKLDAGFFAGSGVAPEIRGLANTTGIQAVSMGANGAQLTNLDAFADGIGLLEQENAHGSAIVLNPRTWRTAIKLKEQASGSNKPLLQQSAGAGTAGVERSLYGLPVFLSSQISTTEVSGTSGAVCSSAYIYEASRLYAVARQDVTVTVDRGGTYFASDQAAIRTISRWDLVVPDPKAVVKISGILP